jgi:hypothetical protein
MWHHMRVGLIFLDETKISSRDDLLARGVAVDAMQLPTSAPWAGRRADSPHCHQ